MVAQNYQKAQEFETHANKKKTRL